MFSRRAFVFVVLPLALAAEPARAQQVVVHPPLNVTAPYDAVTDSRTDVVNFNPEPFTGMAFDGDGRIWAVNPYASTIVLYHAITPAPDLVVPTGLNPVSVGVWEPAADARRVLVACNGTHGLFVHDQADGRLVAFVGLDSEPADLVVDEDNDRAFVSCQGDDTVDQIELGTMTVSRRYKITCGKRPGPLYLDRGDPDIAADNRVYVAAAITGNNSVPLGAGQQAAGSVRDLDSNPPDEQLPDEDVFRIDPTTGTIASVVQRAGSLIFEIDRNPETLDLWILSTDSINKDPDLFTEPLLRGVFATNQLVKVAGVTSTSGLVLAPRGRDLDDLDPNATGGQYDAARSLNQARTLDFVTIDGVEGYALVASAQSDVIVALNPNGNRVLTFDLPAGAQCFDIELWPLDEHIFAALCLGTMTIEAFRWQPYSPTPFGSVPLGLDPTPDQVRRGRDVFLDGQRSADGRFSCASCHPRGMTDLLGWPLRGHPTDEKDIMLTQSLLSIADTFPHHWRGERDLEDFRKAFGGLLGAPADEVPTAEEMDDFVVFVQSLQAPANPIENPRRVLDDSLGTNPAPNGMNGSAIGGQQPFQTVVNFNGQTCAGCHMLETGDDGTHLSEVVGSRAPRAIPLEVAHLRQLQHRSLDTVMIDLNGNGNEIEFNENGFGAAHNGSLPTVFNFIFDIPVFQTLDDQQRVNVFRFVEQFDQGISPAAHWAARYVQGSSATVANNIKTILVDKVAQGWNDVAAFGRYNKGLGMQPMRWWYDSSQQRFVSEDPSVAALTWADMKSKTQQGLAENVFVGLPPQSGRRYGIDHDRDGSINGQELIDGTDPWDPDTDGDGWPDGYEKLNGDDPLVFQTASHDTTPPGLVSSELDFANSRLAKYHVRFSEDVTYTVTYSTPGGPAHAFARDYFCTADTFVLTHAEPSTTTQPPLTFDVAISFQDRKGNPSGPVALPTFQPHESAFPSGTPILNNHVAEMTWVKQDRLGDTLDAEVRIKLDTNYGAPFFDLIEAVDEMVFCIVSVKDAQGNFVQSETFTTTHDTEFKVLKLNGVDVVDYEVDPGPPWICSPKTLANGETTIAFQLPGLQPGQEVKVSVMGAVLETDPPQTPTVYTEFSLFQMQPLLLEDTMELSLIF